MSVVFASTFVELPDTDKCRISFRTKNAPSGKYELRVILETERGESVGSVSKPLSLTSKPGPFSIRLSGSASVQSEVNEKKRAIQ